VLNLFADNSSGEFEPNSDLELNKYGRIKRNIENKYMDLKSQQVKEVNIVNQQLKLNERIKQDEIIKQKREKIDKKETNSKDLILEIQKSSNIKKLPSKIDFKNKTNSPTLDDNFMGKQVQYIKSLGELKSSLKTDEFILNSDS